MSVPTNEVRNNLDRNPGLRSPGGIPPPLDIALLSMHNPRVSVYVQATSEFDQLGGKAINICCLWSLMGSGVSWMAVCIASSSILV